MNSISNQTDLSLRKDSLGEKENTKTLKESRSKPAKESEMTKLSTLPKLNKEPFKQSKLNQIAQQVSSIKVQQAQSKPIVVTEPCQNAFQNSSSVMVKNRPLEFKEEYVHDVQFRIKDQTTQVVPQMRKVKNLSEITMNPRVHLLKPVQAGHKAGFTIQRDSTLFSHHLKFSCQGSAELILKCTKEFKFSKSLVHFQSVLPSVEELGQKIVRPELGWIEGNFDGSLFNVFETDEYDSGPELVATIEYLPPTAKNGGPRQVKLYFKDKTNKDYKKSYERVESLKELHEREKNSPNNFIKCVKTLEPVYDNQSDCYYLAFRSQSPTVPSVHNMILVDSQMRPVIKMHKAQSRQYKLQCYNGIRPYVACAFAMSSFIFKLVSE